jgi:hypothetical protein
VRTPRSRAPPRRGHAETTEAEAAALTPFAEFTEPPLDPQRTVRALTVWATLFGHLSLELFGHLHRAVPDYDAHFAQVVDQLAADLGLAAED